MTQQPLQITFRGMEPSTFVEARVRELAARLDRFEGRLTSCHVTIQAPHQHHRNGQPYGVTIRVGLAGGEIVVDHEGSQNPAREDVYVALRDAFDAALRKLEARASRLAQRARRHTESHRRTG